jgi:hypothetical protein
MNVSPCVAVLFHRIGPYHFAQLGIIADGGPERFAGGLMRAVQVATRRPPPQAAWFDQALLGAFARRPR